MCLGSRKNGCIFHRGKEQHETVFMLSSAFSLVAFPDCAHGDEVQEKSLEQSFDL